MEKPEKGLSSRPTRHTPTRVPLFLDVFCKGAAARIRFVCTFCWILQYGTVLR